MIAYTADVVKDRLHLTPAEFEIIEHLWSSSRRLSVNDVLERIRRRREVAYTTIMTLLDKMARKGSVKRVKEGKAYLYSPAVDRPQVQAYLLQDFAANYFGGEVSRIAAFLASQGDESGGDAGEDSVPQNGSGGPQPSEAPTPAELDVTLL